MNWPYLSDAVPPAARPVPRGARFKEADGTDTTRAGYSATASGPTTTSEGEPADAGGTSGGTSGGNGRRRGDRA